MSLINTIRKIAVDAGNAQSPLRIVEAVVVSAPPNIQIKLKSNARLVIPSELIIIAEHLTRHKRQIRASGGTTNEYEFMDELKTNDKVMVVILQGGQSFFILDRVG